MNAGQRGEFPPNWYNSGFMGLLHDYINYDKEIMKIGSDACSVFMDYETNCKCIICKNQMLNACSVLLIKDGVYTHVIHTHAHILSHTYASFKCYNISVNVVVYLCTLIPE